MRGMVGEAQTMDGKLERNDELRDTVTLHHTAWAEL